MHYNRQPLGAILIYVINASSKKYKANREEQKQICNRMLQQIGIFWDCKACRENEYRNQQICQGVKNKSKQANS